MKASDIERQTKKCGWRYGIFNGRPCRGKIHLMGVCFGHYHQLLAAKEEIEEYKERCKHA